MKICKRKFRVVTDLYSGFEVQIWLWYYPFWQQIGINTQSSRERALKFIDKYKLENNFKPKVIETFKCDKSIDI